MKILRYNPSMKPMWDEFIDSSKNATFLLKRDYMDYHADRFTDFSLILTDDDGNIETLFPASVHDSGKTVKSHGGLTYGGFIMTDRTSGTDPLKWIEAITRYYRETGVSDLYYKPIPYIYHRHPSDDDLYALFRANATLSVRNLATVIDLRHRIHSSRLTKRAEKRQRQSGITIQEVNDINLFWQIIVDDRRLRHNTTPVHTADELSLLHRSFPEQIRLFTASLDSGDILAGAVIYRAGQVLHLQYAAATGLGKDLYATDIIYHHVIFNAFPDAEYFDFGTSNEDAGRYLNHGMVRHKEEFGGRSIIYDTYHIPL